MEGSALISPCGRYRYWLHRVWDPTRAADVFLMLNPSTADASQDDPTIRKCVGFASRMGAGSILVINLFALRATDPGGLLEVGDPVGPDNDSCLVERARGHVVAAWGAGPPGARGKQLLRARVQVVRELLAGRDLLALGTCQDGSPRHPLFVPYTARPDRFSWPAG